MPVSSQTLVFSKTSLQVAHISPEHPRALYFGDDVYVGLVHGGLLEVTAVDPQRGAIFYVMEQKKAARPRFVRKNEECLKCHFSVNTMRVPGFLTRSVFADSSGNPIVEAGAYLTDHRSRADGTLGRLVCDWHARFGPPHGKRLRQRIAQAGS